MKYIIEHYGTGLLSGTAAFLLLSFFFKMLESGGALNTLVKLFTTGIAG